MARRMQLSLVAVLGVLAMACGTSARMPPLEDQLCDTCLVATRILSDFLCDPAATEFVLEMVEKQLCPATPDPDQCQQITDAIVPVLIQWLRASATPQEMCASAGVCGAQLPPRPFMALHKPHQLKDGAECPLCTFVLNQAKAMLADPITQAKVKEAALSACGKLPTDFVPTCTDMVNKYEALLVVFVESTDTMQACAVMGLCTGALGAMFKPAPLPIGLVQALHEARPRLEGAMMPARPMVPFGGPGPRGPHPGPHPGFGFGGAPNSDMCSMCKLMVTEVDTLIENPAVQENIQAWAEAVCAKASIPADWQNTCTDLVDTYVPQLFSILITTLQPDPMCEQLHMCDPAPPPIAQVVEGAFAKLSGMLQGLFGALQGKSASQLVGGFERLQASEAAQAKKHVDE